MENEVNKNNIELSSIYLDSNIQKNINQPLTKPIDKAVVVDIEHIFHKDIYIQPSFYTGIDLKVDNPMALLTFAFFAAVRVGANIYVAKNNDNYDKKDIVDALKTEFIIINEKLDTLLDASLKSSCTHLKHAQEYFKVGEIIQGKKELDYAIECSVDAMAHQQKNADKFIQAAFVNLLAKYLNLIVYPSLDINRPHYAFYSQALVVINEINQNKYIISAIESEFNNSYFFKKSREQLLKSLSKLNNCIHYSLHQNEVLQKDINEKMTIQNFNTRYFDYYFIKNPIQINAVDWNNILTYGNIFITYTNTEIKAWNINNGKCINQLKINDEMKICNFITDTMVIFFVTNWMTWDINTGETKILYKHDITNKCFQDKNIYQIMQKHIKYMTNICILNGNEFISISTDLVLWNFNNDVPFKFFQCEKIYKSVKDFSFVQDKYNFYHVQMIDNDNIICYDRNNLLFILNLRNNKWKIINHYTSQKILLCEVLHINDKNYIPNTSYIPNGSYILCGSSCGVFALWDMNGNKIHTWQMQNSNTHSIKKIKKINKSDYLLMFNNGEIGRFHLKNQTYKYLLKIAIYQDTNMLILNDDVFMLQCGRELLLYSSNDGMLIRKIEMSHRICICQLLDSNGFIVFLANGQANVYKYEL